jgi:large subunit ribosomal protein L1
MKRSKKYEASAKLIDRSKKYDVDEAVKLLPQISFSKFAGSVEVNVYLNLNDKQKKESIRGAYSLPNAFGKAVRVLVFCDPADAPKAKGADFIGAEDLMKEVEGGKTDFDIVLTTPAMMPKIARLGKVLGSKGLMPNPKNGTITTDLETTIKTFKSGRKNYKASDVGLITAVVGKTDMKPEDLKANIVAFATTIFADTKKFNPAPLKAITLAPTMGPKISLDVNKLAL